MRFAGRRHQHRAPRARPPRGPYPRRRSKIVLRRRRGELRGCERIQIDPSSLLAFPAKAGIYCVPRMALNLEVKVLFGPQGAEPLANGNCVAAMRGGEEVGGKSGGRRTDIG